MIFRSSFLILATFLVLANGQNFEFGGGCPPAGPMANFDMGRFLGKWYEVMKHPIILDPTGKCATQTFSPEFFWHKMDYKRTESFTNIGMSTGFTVIPVSFTPGVYILLFIFQTYPIPIGYNIIDTDYSTYAITGSCIDLGVAKIKFTWVLSRNSTAASDQNFINSMNAKMAAKNMTTNLGMVSHSGCPSGYDLLEESKN